VIEAARRVFGWLRKERSAEILRLRLIDASMSAGEITSSDGAGIRST
jgi:hypothetical protein